MLRENDKFYLWDFKSFWFLQLVDMHAGPGDLATNDHESTALRLKEITDAHRISQGPFFLVSAYFSHWCTQNITGAILCGKCLIKSLMHTEYHRAILFDKCFIKWDRTICNPRKSLEAVLCIFRGQLVPTSCVMLRNANMFTVSLKVSKH